MQAHTRRGLTLASCASLILAISTLFTSPIAAAHNGPGYSHDSGAKTSHPRWMTALPDSRRLHELSIPGTHDTLSFYGGDIVQTQSMSLSNQLNSGIRALDVRCRSINNVFAIHHGPIFQKTFFGDVLNDAIAFLDQNPGEAIFMRVKEEHTASSTLSFEQIFQNYVNQYRNHIWQGTSNNPTLGEVRGKIVILQNFSGARYGIPYGAFDIQDQYSMTTNWDLYKKWEAVKGQLDKANNDTSSQKYMNYLSASGGSFPYFVASGHSSPGTSAPRLSTGLTTPGWKSSYPDFPRVACFIGICTIAFEGTNELTYSRLRGNNYRRVGIVMADFPGPGLINEIVALNNQGVTLYQHSNYGGYRVTLGEGSYNMTQLNALGVRNDDISSIKVPPGYQIAIFEHSSFNGARQDFTSDTSSLGGFNDKLSSVIVYRL